MANPSKTDKPLKSWQPPQNLTNPSNPGKPTPQNLAQTHPSEPGKPSLQILVQTLLNLAQTNPSKPSLGGQVCELVWKEDSGSRQVQDIAAQVRGFGTGGAVTEEMLSRIQLRESV